MGEWIRHDGAGVPVTGDTVVEIDLRRGAKTVSTANAFRWTWGRADPFDDIVAYRLVDAETIQADHDAVEHPTHYTSHPSGIECIQITEHMGFNLGNAVKYVWRADLKHDAIEDLRKAKWYIERELQKRGAA